MTDVVEAFHDKKALHVQNRQSGTTVFKPVNCTKETFFSPEESKSIQMSLPKLPKAEDLRRTLVDNESGLVTYD